MSWIRAMAIALLVLASLPAQSRAADCSAGPGDLDGDGVCDAHDPCAGFGGAGIRMRDVSMTLRKLGGRPTDDTLRFRGVIPLGAGVNLDPSVTGLRLTVLDNAWTSDDLMLDVAAPGGPGWTANAGGRSWTFRSTDPTTDGIKRALVKEVDANPAYVRPRALSVTLDARRGTYDGTSDLESHFVTLAFAGSGTADVCAELPFYPWLFTGLPGVDPWEALPWQPSCKFRGNGRTLECATGPKVGPCRVSIPGDMMICDAQNAAGAQEQYRNDTGAYYTGSCAGLPGFVGSPNVTCNTAGSDTTFTVSTFHVDPSPWFECDWNSQGTPNLTCF
jgi:hypothetical protein